MSGNLIELSIYILFTGLIMSFISKILSSLPICAKVYAGESVTLDEIRKLNRLGRIDFAFSGSFEEYNRTVRKWRVDRDKLTELFKETCPNKKFFVYRCLDLDEFSGSCGGGNEGASAMIYRCVLHQKESLDLSGRISTLPNRLHYLEHIHELDISNNSIGITSIKIPSSVRKLNISNTGMNLANFTSRLKNLTHLFARNNTNLSLPSNCDFLKKLVVLDVRGNPIMKASLNQFKVLFQKKAPEGAEFLYDTEKESEKKPPEKSEKSERTKMDFFPAFLRSANIQPLNPSPGCAQPWRPRASTTGFFGGHTFTVIDTSSFTPVVIEAARKARIEQLERQREAEARVQAEEEASRARAQAKSQADRNTSDLAILGLTPGKTRAEIRAKYRKSALVLHPDKIKQEERETEEEFKIRKESCTSNFYRKQEAYERLMENITN